MQQDADKALHVALESSKAVLFCGAGVSLQAPAGIPDWRDFRDRLIVSIARRSEVANRYVSVLLEAKILGSSEQPGINPEMVASYVRDLLGDNWSECLRAFNIGSPNVNHLWIGEQCAACKFPAVITTNFDVFIERALEQKGVECKSIRTDDEFRAFCNQREQSRQIPVLKLHGCISAPETILATVEQQSHGLPRVRLDALLALMRQYSIVFWGYSGADFKVDLDYLGLVSNAATIKPMIWSLFRSADFEEKPRPELLKLVEIYGERLQIGHTLLPIAPVPAVAINGGTPGLTLESMMSAWAEERVSAVMASAIVGSLLLVLERASEARACFEHCAQAGIDGWSLPDLRLGHCARLIEGDQAAIGFYQRTASIASQSSDTESLAAALGNLADSTARLGRLEEAEKLARQAIEIGAIAVTSSYLLAHARETLGDITRMRGDPEEAIPQYQDAIERLTDLGMKTLIPQLLVKAAIAHRYFGEVREAERKLFEARALSRAFDSAAGILAAETELAAGAMLERRFDDAKTALECAERIASQVRDDRLQAGLSHAKATLAAIEGDHAAAARLYQEEVAVHQANHDLVAEGSALNNLAGSLEFIGKHEQAEASYTKAIELFYQVGDRLRLAFALEGYGILLLKQGRLAESVRRLDAALALAAFGRAGDPAEIYEQRWRCEAATPTPPDPITVFEQLLASAEQTGEMSALVAELAQRYGHPAEQGPLLLVQEWLADNNAQVGPFAFIRDLSAHASQLRVEKHFDNCVAILRLGTLLSQMFRLRYAESFFTNEYGLLLMDLGVPKEAHAFFLRSAQMEQQLFNDAELAARCYNLAVIARKAGYIDGAISFFQQALQAAERSGNTQNQQRVLADFGESLLEAERYPDALETFKDAESLAGSRGDSIGQARAQLRAGRAAWKMRDYLQSNAFRQRGLETLAAQGLFDEAAMAAYQVSTVYAQSLQLPLEAERWFKRSVELAEHSSSTAVRELIKKPPAGAAS